MSNLQIYERDNIVNQFLEITKEEWDKETDRRQSLFRIHRDLVKLKKGQEGSEEVCQQQN